MDKTEALKALGLDENASTEDIQTALKSKKQDIAEKKAAAPTDALKAKFESLEAKLAEAEKVLRADSSRSKPAGDNGSLTGVIKQTGPSPLSQTKLADLPGLAPQDAAQVELQPGQTIANRYEIKELIGQGGMGAVYRAFDKNRDEDIAIKVLLPSLTKNERALERFLNEARVSSKLSHQHIVNVYDVQSAPQIDGSGDLYFLIMELLEGQDLAKLIQTREQLNQPFTAKELTEVIEQLSPALDYAHQHTVHRDIKPENIWLDEDGQYKLMDFGIAQLQSTSQRTQTGAAMGTAYYMAPEQLKGSKNVDARADIYALGVMLYAMATGDVPAGLIKPLHEKRPDISPAFSNAVMQCLEADPEDRPQSAGELLGLLQKGLTAKGAKTRKSKTAKSSRPASAANLHGGGPNKLAVAVALLLFLGGGAFAWQQGWLDALKPLDKELIAQQKAEATKLLGRIKSLQRRLDASQRDLEGGIRDAKQDGGDRYATLQAWRDSAETHIFRSERLMNLQGELAVGEEYLKKDSTVGDAVPVLSMVKLGYGEMVDCFDGLEGFQDPRQKLSDYLAQWNYTIKDVMSDELKVIGDQLSEAKGERDKCKAVSLTAEAIAIARLNMLKGTLVEIPAGSFQMGSNDGESHERPVHRVSVKAFDMQEHEVTWGQFLPCVQTGACSKPPAMEYLDLNGKLPATKLSFKELKKYIAWLNKETGDTFRLPSEAEWEYAARAGTTEKYSWGDQFDSRYATHACDKIIRMMCSPSPVKSYPPNPWGLYDMHGNASEIVQDCWHDNYKGAPSDGSAWMAEGGAKTTKAGGCFRNVVRGGMGFGGGPRGPDQLRSAFRSNDPYAYQTAGVGFRLVRDH